MHHYARQHLVCLLTPNGWGNSNPASHCFPFADNHSPPVFLTVELSILRMASTSGEPMWLLEAWTPSNTLEQHCTQSEKSEKERWLCPRGVTPPYSHVTWDRCGTAPAGKSILIKGFFFLSTCLLSQILKNQARHQGLCKCPEPMFCLLLRLTGHMTLLTGT